MRLYTWCALDTLMFPALLERTAHVTSSCHTTGDPSVRAGFCQQVHFFFAGPDAAAPRLVEHPEAAVVGVQEGHRLAQPLVQALLDGDGSASCC